MLPSYLVKTWTEGYKLNSYSISSSTPKPGPVFALEGASLVF